EVYYAVSDAGRQVALKAVQNYEEIELRGISHCMNLKSQHLVSIFDVKHGTDGTPWVIMEFVAGPSLRDILDESPRGIGAEKASFFVRELAKGLAYLHGAGVVHRDLKPHNVFFEEGVVKIGDYSLSKVITTSHRSGHTMTVGTVHYMAPEIGMGRYDKTVDIYALGVMLYEMLTGSPPYVGDSMGEVLMKHLSSEPDVSQLEEPFASVIRKAMQRDAADRYQSTEEMAAALQGVHSSADSLTGFGPASLSIVADRAARQSWPDSEASTGRVDAAMTSTQREQPAEEWSETHPMRQLGRDLGNLVFHAAIASGGGTKRVPVQPDPVARFWRVTLAVITLVLMPLIGAMLSELVGTYTHTTSISDTWGPFFHRSGSLPMSSVFLANACRVLVPSVAVVLAAWMVRVLITRRNISERPLLCRFCHVLLALVVLTLMLMLRISPLEKIYLANLLPVLTVISVQNWALLTSPSRVQRIRLGPVLFAALIAFVAGEFVGANSMLVVAAASGSALATQVWSGFSPPHRQPARTEIPQAIAETNPAATPVGKNHVNALVAVESLS
ncbi:MAG: serine/threonine protein kinase, partial [Pirellulales bacterium]|nr:serine/threonine protein kinase [Pirellulales bacterium]